MIFIETITVASKAAETNIAQENLALQKDKHVTDVEMKVTQGDASMDTLIATSKRAVETDLTARNRAFSTGKLPGKADDYMVKTEKLQSRVVTLDQDAQEKAESKRKKHENIREALSSKEDKEFAKEEATVAEETAMQNQEEESVQKVHCFQQEAESPKQAESPKRPHSPPPAFGSALHRTVLQRKADPAQGTPEKNISEVTYNVAEPTPSGSYSMAGKRTVSSIGQLYIFLLVGVFLSSSCVAFLIYFNKSCTVNTALKIASDYNSQTINYRQARFLLINKLHYTESDCNSFLGKAKRDEPFSN